MKARVSGGGQPDGSSVLPAPAKRMRRTRAARICLVAGAIAVALALAFWGFFARTTEAADGQICQTNLRAMYLMSRLFWPGEPPGEWGSLEELARSYPGRSRQLITEEEYQYLSGRPAAKQMPEKARRGSLGAVAAGVPWVCPSDPRRKEARGQGSVIEQLPPSYKWKPMSGVVAHCAIHHLDLLDSGAVRKVPW